MTNEIALPKELATKTSAAPDVVERLWQDMDALSRDSKAISDSELAEWKVALEGIGGLENASCSFSRWSAPRRNEKAELPRYIADAMELAMTGSLSRLLRLSVWFDTPVVAQHKDTWVKDRFDIETDHSWSLINIDERHPTEKEQHDYDAEKLASAAAIKRVEDIVSERGGDFSYNNHPAALRDYFERHPPTKTLHDSETALVLMSEPARRSKDPLVRHTSATYVILRDEPQLHSFEISNRRAFSPHMGIRVSNYRKFGTLDSDPITKTQVLRYLEQTYQIRLTYVFKQAIEHRQWFSDFECN